MQKQTEVEAIPINDGSKPPFNLVKHNVAVSNCKKAVLYLHYIIVLVLFFKTAHSFWNETVNLNV